MLSRDDPDKNLSFVDEENEEEMELPSCSVIPSTTLNSEVLGYTKNIKDLRIGQDAVDFLAAEWRGAICKIRLKTSVIYVKHMRST